MKKFLYVLLGVYLCCLVHFIINYRAKSVQNSYGYSTSVRARNGFIGYSASRGLKPVFSNYNFSTSKSKGESWDLTMVPTTSYTPHSYGVYNEVGRNNAVSGFVTEHSSAAYRSVGGGMNGASSGNYTPVLRSTNNAVSYNTSTSTLRYSGTSTVSFASTNNEWQSTSRYIASNELSYQGTRLNAPFSDNDDSDNTGNQQKAAIDDPYIGGLTPIGDSCMLFILAAIYGLLIFIKRR